MEDEVSETGTLVAKRRGSPQYRLRTLFWLTTLIAAVCAPVGWAIRSRPEAPGTVLFVMMFYFWPTFAAVVAWTWPSIRFATRILVAVAIGGAVLLLTWGHAWITGELPLAIFAAKLAFIIAWCPQAFLIGVVAIAVAISRRGDQAADGQVGMANMAGPQSGRPLGRTDHGVDNSTQSQGVPGKRFTGCLGSAAVVFLLFGVMFRPDGDQDLLASVVWNAVVTGPLSAAAAFLLCRKAPTDTTTRKGVAIIAAMVVYFAVLSSMHACNLMKMEARISAARHAEQMMKQNDAAERRK